MILQELCSLYERMAGDPSCDVPPMGWSLEKVAWEIVIGADGEVRAILPLTTGEGKTAVKFQMMRVPEQTTRSSGVKAFFCCDNAKYLFGLDEKRGTRLLEASRALHHGVLDGCDDPEAHALLAFFGRDDHLAQIDDATIEAIQGGGLMTFRLLGASHYIFDAKAVKVAWNRYCEREDDAPIGFCSVTGEESPLARLFPQVTGIPGAQSSGASLISFNFSSSESYELDGTYNASLSKKAAFEAGAAFKMLMTNRERRISFGNTYVVYWADRRAAQEESALFSMFGGDTKAEDKETIQILERALKHMSSGGSAVPEFDYETRFYLLGISPNAARLSVRFFYQSTFGDLLRSYLQYREDVAVAGVKTTALSRLLSQLAAQGKRENIPSTVIARSFFAMVSGSLFPEAMLQILLMRMRADHASNNKWDLGQRASLLKACLVRKRRKKGVLITDKERIGMEMNPKNESVGYLLGRLFAVLERTQTAALGDINASIRDKYIGAASTTPARIFPTLLRGYEVHQSTLRKKDGGSWKGLAVKLDREYNDIASLLPAPLPRALNSEAQGEFYIAFHQEQQALWKGAGDKASARDVDAATSEKEE